MSTPTFPDRPDDRTEWLLPRPGPAPQRGRTSVPGRRRRFATALDVAARVGTAGTLAALLVLTGTVLTLFDAAPVPTGATTAGR